MGYGREGGGFILKLESTTTWILTLAQSLTNREAESQLPPLLGVHVSEFRVRPPVPQGWKWGFLQL